MTTWMTVKQYAAHCRQSERTVRKWFEKGLPYTRTPTGGFLIDAAKADEWLWKNGSAGVSDDELERELLGG